DFMQRLSSAALSCGPSTAAAGREAPPPTPGGHPAVPPPAPAATTPASPVETAQPTADEQAADASAIQAPQKWTGDLDGMIDRRLIRVLTTYSKTTFFIDRGTQLGLVADAIRLFEEDLTKRLKIQ